MVRRTAVTLRLQDTRARAVWNVLGNVYLSSLTKNLEYTKSVSNLILAVEVRCHKVQGMMEAFFDGIIPGKFICCLAREKR